MKNLGKNRDRLSIIAAILDASHSESSKTRIMLDANLSFSVSEKYIGVCIELGFVYVQNSKYKLTERGRQFLNQYRNFENRYARAQNLFENLNCERERLSQLCEGPKLIQTVPNLIQAHKLKPSARNNRYLKNRV